MIPLVVLEEGSYEKDVLIYVNLGVPQMVGGMCDLFLLLTLVVVTHALWYLRIYTNKSTERPTVECSIKRKYDVIKS